MMSRLTVDRLGARGEGVAQGPEGLIYVPYALAGETIAAEVDGSRGTLVEVLAPSPSRIALFRRYFSRCGGCAVQKLAADSYARWKRDLVASALRRAGLAITVADLADAHGAGRRRATFHARYVQGRPMVNSARMWRGPPTCKTAFCSAHHRRVSALRLGFCALR
jgi:23S rRNA (uracil1939-C5)-methyltransferase